MFHTPTHANEVDTFVNFPIPPINEIQGASTLCTCDFVIKNPQISNGSQIVQLFSLLEEFDVTQTFTWNNHPQYDQYYGSYLVNPTGSSTLLDLYPYTVQCSYGSNLRFVMRPYNATDWVMLSQTGIVISGAYIEIRN